MNLVQKIKSRLLIQQPFYATLLLSLPLIEDTNIPTACTNMKEIRYNPAFFAEIGESAATFVLVHEVMHVALMHGFRQHERVMPYWNYACDFAINLTLVDSGFTMPADPHAGLLDRKYEGWSAEQIYDDLCRKQPEEPDGGDQDGDQEGQPGDQDGRQPGKQRGGWGTQTDLAPVDMTADQVDQARERLRQTVATAANMARMAGKMPAALERLVDTVLNPQVPWQDLLRDYMTRTTKDDETWSRRNRRFGRVYLPSRHSERMGEIGIIGDTSGSIGHDELVRMTSEVRAICDSVRPERLRVLWADADVAGRQVFEDGDPFTPEPKGGGGTDMRVPLAEFEQHEPEVVVLFTDGYTPWPDGEPPYPLIVCCTTNVDVPIGQVIRVTRA